MKSFLLFFITMLSGVLAIAQQQVHPVQQYSTPLHYGFIQNKGQVVDAGGQPDTSVCYLFMDRGLNVQLRTQGWTYEVFEIKKMQPRISEATGMPEEKKSNEPRATPEKSVIQTHRINVQLAGSNPHAQLVAYNAAPDYIHYYSADKHDAGILNVQHYRRVVYKDIYPHIDIEFMITAQHGIKYNFIVHEGGDYRDIKLRYVGAQGIGVCEKPATTLQATHSSLSIMTQFGELREEIPYSYQLINCHQQQVQARYKLAHGLIGLEINGSVQADAPLVIDPVVFWASYVGGSGEDACHAIDVDVNGNILMAGKQSRNSPLVMKFSSEGIPQWSIFYIPFFTVDFTEATDVASDIAGNVYVTGDMSKTTAGSTLPTPGAHQDSIAGNNGIDAFVLKFSSSGVRQWGTFYGGTGSDQGNAIAVGASGTVYIVGETSSDSGISTSGSHHEVFAPAPNSLDVFIVKFSNTGVRQWGTYYGGEGWDWGNDMVLDEFENIYLTGQTHSDTGIVTTGVHRETKWGNNAAFVAKFDSAGSRLWGTYYGTSATGEGIAIDKNSGVYITGYTDSRIYISTPGSYQPNLADEADAFIAKFNNTGTSLIWGTYYGGTDDDYGLDISTDSNGYVCLAGMTRSPSGIATYDALRQNYAGQTDAFVAKFTNDGRRIWGTYYGGNEGEGANSVVLGDDGMVYLAGGTSSINSIATPGAAQTTYGGLGDGFIAKFWAGGASTPYYVKGTVVADSNSNCSIDSTDIPRPFLLLKAEPGNYYGLTDTAGKYTLYLPDTGSYVVSTVISDTLWSPSCVSSRNVHLTTTPDRVNGIDFTLQAAYYCPRLSVDIGSVLLRPCTNSVYYISCLNTGTLPALNASVEIDFGNELLPQSSTIPWTSVSGNVYTFPIGTLHMWQGKQFEVTVKVSCSALMGTTHCVTAHIYPDSLCTPAPAGWDKSETQVSGACMHDSLVCFTIKNRSSAGSGDMNGAAQWRLYINDTLITQGTYQLAGHDSLVKCFPANGKTYRLEADQNFPHPGNSRPRAVIEACGNPTFALGFVNTVSQDDGALFVETICAEIRTSFDPNDKQVNPAGITSSHYITADDELQYLIRFQNTGNDTAFKVVIRDTISTDVLDIVTLTSMASSHDYTFNIYGQGIAEWRFDNILLPDSNINEPASHGFVQFKINQKPGNNNGTRIENSADIYFDFNAPVTTNTVWNEVNVAGMPESFFSAVLSIPCADSITAGSASIDASGGLMPYFYQWSNGLTTASVLQLAPGDYAVTVGDAAGTIQTDSLSIAAFLDAITSTQNVVTCFGGNDAAAKVNASGGTPPFSYLWSTGQTQASITNLNAGNYQVTITDSSGCITIAAIDITDGMQVNTGFLTGVDTADINHTTSYSVNTGLTTYTWNVTNGAIISGQGTNTIVIDWFTTGHGELQVITTDQSCADTVSKTITLVDPVGINGSVPRNIILYPNPTNGTINLQYPGITGMVLLQLHNSVGKKILDQPAATSELRSGIMLDISTLPEGVYFLRLRSTNEEWVAKVIRM